MQSENVTRPPSDLHCVAEAFKAARNEAVQNADYALASCLRDGEEVIRREISARLSAPTPAAKLETLTEAELSEFRILAQDIRETDISISGEVRLGDLAVRLLAALDAERSARLSAEAVVERLQMEAGGRFWRCGRCFHVMHSHNPVHPCACGERHYWSQISYAEWKATRAAASAARQEPPRDDTRAGESGRGG